MKTDDERRLETIRKIRRCATFETKGREIIGVIEDNEKAVEILAAHDAEVAREAGIDELRKAHKSDWRNLPSYLEERIANLQSMSPSIEADKSPNADALREARIDELKKLMVDNPYLNNHWGLAAECADRIMKIKAERQKDEETKGIGTSGYLTDDKRDGSPGSCPSNPLASKSKAEKTKRPKAGEVG